MLIVERFDRDIAQRYRDAIISADSPELAAGAVLDIAAEYVYQTEPADWITHWRRINRARFYACARRFPAVNSLTVQS